MAPIQCLSVPNTCSTVLLRIQLAVSRTSRGGFVDKLMESFAGPHDFLGSRTGYDALGNLAHMSDLQHTLFNLQTDLYIPIASVFAIPTLFSQYGLSAGTYLRQSKAALNRRKT